MVVQLEGLEGGDLTYKENAVFDNKDKKEESQPPSEIDASSQSTEDCALLGDDPNEHLEEMSFDDSTSKEKVQIIRSNDMEKRQPPPSAATAAPPLTDELAVLSVRNKSVKSSIGDVSFDKASELVEIQLPKTTSSDENHAALSATDRAVETAFCILSDAKAKSEEDEINGLSDDESTHSPSVDAEPHQETQAMSETEKDLAVETGSQIGSPLVTNANFGECDDGSPTSSIVPQASSTTVGACSVVKSQASIEKGTKHNDEHQGACENTGNYSKDIAEAKLRKDACINKEGEVEKTSQEKNAGNSSKNDIAEAKSGKGANTNKDGGEMKKSPMTPMQKSKIAKEIMRLQELETAKEIMRIRAFLKRTAATSLETKAKYRMEEGITLPARDTGHEDIAEPTVPVTLHNARTSSNSKSKSETEEGIAVYLKIMGGSQSEAADPSIEMRITDSADNDKTSDDPTHPDDRCTNRLAEKTRTSSDAQSKFKVEEGMVIKLEIMGRSKREATDSSVEMKICGSVDDDETTYDPEYRDDYGSDIMAEKMSLAVEKDVLRVATDNFMSEMNECRELPDTRSSTDGPVFFNNQIFLKTSFDSAETYSGLTTGVSTLDTLSINYLFAADPVPVQIGAAWTDKGTKQPEVPATFFSPSDDGAIFVEDLSRAVFEAELQQGFTGMRNSVHQAFDRTFDSLDNKLNEVGCSCISNQCMDDAVDNSSLATTKGTKSSAEESAREGCAGGKRNMKAKGHIQVGANSGAIEVVLGTKVSVEEVANTRESCDVGNIKAQDHLDEGALSTVFEAGSEANSKSGAVKMVGSDDTIKGGVVGKVMQQDQTKGRESSAMGADSDAKTISGAVGMALNVKSSEEERQKAGEYNGASNEQLVDRGALSAVLKADSDAKAEKRVGVVPSTTMLKEERNRFVEECSSGRINQQNLINKEVLSAEASSNTKDKSGKNDGMGLGVRSETSSNSSMMPYHAGTGSNSKINLEAENRMMVDTGYHRDAVDFHNAAKKAAGFRKLLMHGARKVSKKVYRDKKINERV